MALATRVQPISRELELFQSKDLGPKARSAILAAFAAETIAEAAQQNKQVLGVVPPNDIFVDGKKGAPLTSVKPDGVIRAEFQLVNVALAWIYQQLETHSPRLTGQYASSHVLFADGTEVSDVNNPPAAQEYVFINTTPYARKLEGDKKTGRPPSSPQAPDGVYQAVATLARKFSNLAKVSFDYQTVAGGKRNPAIIVRLR